MKPVFSTTITILLVLCALTVTALLAKREFFALSETPEHVYELGEESWELASGQGIMLGEGDAPVKIVVFYDYECSFCRRAAPVLDIILQKYSGKVAIIYRHFPLPRHPIAPSAAIAAECANMQGFFMPYHKSLYEKQGSLGDDDWILIAKDIGIPETEAFLDCMDGDAIKQKLDVDERLAHSLGITSIPTLIVNGRLFSGLLSVAELDAIVQDALSQSD